MGRIISVVALAVAVGLFLPLYNAKTMQSDPSSLEGVDTIIHMVLNRAVLEASPVEATSHLEPQADFNKESSGVELILNTISSELTPKEEKSPSEVCAIFGPFKEAKLEHYHSVMEKVGINSKVLIEPVVLPTKIRLITKFLTATEAPAIEDQLTGFGIPFEKLSKGANTAYQLGGEFTDIVKVETFLNRIRQKIPTLNVQIEREASEAGAMVQLVFLEMKEDEFTKVKKFVQEQGATLKGCPY